MPINMPPPVQIIAPNPVSPPQQVLQDQIDIPPHPQSSWVLVIPYSVDNAHVIWGHNSEWSRQWEAPVRINGLRLVTDMGDYNDHKDVDDVMKNPEDNADKFVNIEDRLGANTLAIVKYDNGNVNLNVILPDDTEISEDIHNKSDDEKSLKQDVVNRIGYIVHQYNSQSPQPTPKPSLPSPISNGVDISDLPQQLPGQYGFSIVMDSSRMDIIHKMQSVIPTLSGIKIATNDLDDTGIEMTGYYQGTKEMFVSNLINNGIPIYNP